MVYSSRIFTPGHGKYVDALLLYGISYLMEQFNLSERSIIKPLGDYYEVVLAESLTKDFYFKLYELLKNEYEERKRRNKVIFGFQQEDKFMQKFFQKFEEFLTKNVPPLDQLYSKQPSWNKWREECDHMSINALNTLYISLAPHLGKYQYDYNKGVNSNFHKICPICYSLIMLGCLVGTFSVNILSRGSQMEIFYGFYVPYKESNLKVLNKVSITTSLNWRERRKPINDFPTISTPLIVLKDKDMSFLQDLKNLNPSLYSYRLSPTGKGPGVWAIRSVSEHLLAPYIDFLSIAKEEDAKLIEDIIDRLIQDYPELLNLLSLAIHNRNIDTFNSFLREAIRKENLKTLSQNIIFNLYKNNFFI